VPDVVVDSSPSTGSEVDHESPTTEEVGETFIVDGKGEGGKEEACADVDK
jgi:hypothetical protein